jgi:hydrogenase maturation protein HypF
VRERLRIAICGAVQGVGFRPFVFRLARELDLAGWVRNSPQGVFIEAEGPRGSLEQYLRRLASEPPPRAVIQGLEATWLDPVPYTAFEIRESDPAGMTTALVLPDIAMCDACRRDIETPADRRYRYPFTNCTNCGPRFSIIDALPYDRANTSMRQFVMCAECEREYHDPADRRFHAQPNGCPVCGPQLELWNADGQALAARDHALRRAAAAVRAGQIVAVKGLGGFQLVVDARNDAAVARLRDRKRRPDKPFALMYPSLAAVEEQCEVSPLEARLLLSPEAPIVLLERRREAAANGVAPGVAPGNPTLGAMLPYTPLHTLLLGEVGGPVIATSGNVADEPMCIDEQDAVDRLWGIADLFLVHNRPIVRHVDDSIVRVMLGRELVLRRARGYAPLPIPLRRPAPPVVAVGAHLKNTVAITSGANAFISQHIGDLESRQSSEAFFEVLASFERLYRVAPEAVAADLHPDYLSTRYADALGLPVLHVQHHYAHVMGCMAENDLDGPALGVSWDGTGYGTDGAIWGGEFLAVADGSFRRAAALRPFRLPGGECAVRQPRRCALGLLYGLSAEGADAWDLPSVHAFSGPERRLLLQALQRGVNAPVTTSAGRLFDAAASLIGLRQRSSFEGQAAMDLEFAVDRTASGSYPFAVASDVERFALGPWEPPDVILDWRPTIEALIQDVRAGQPPGVIAARFHHALVEMIVAVAHRGGARTVVLTGGCFQNRYLTERAVARLREEGFRPYWHQRVPPNDGGISLGQIAALVRHLAIANLPSLPHCLIAPLLHCR